MGERDIKRVLIALIFGSVLRPAASRAADPALCRRLGGYDAIAAVTDKYLERPEREHRELVAAVAGLKEDIVEI